MIGGYQILDLRGLDLEITQSEQSLTNKNVLDQLLLFRDYIDKAYDFNKPLENQLKPVLIRFRDKKNGEKIEGATFGELSVKDNYYTFQVTGRISGAYTLQIIVEFKEITNDYGNQEWVIKTATIQLIDASNVLEGDVAIDGDLTVSGSFNGQANPSVKPIYCHPISIYDVSNEDATKKFFATCLIFNNSGLAFTKETFLDFVRSLATTLSGRIMISGGGYQNENGAIIFSSLFYDSTNEKYIFEGFRATVGTYTVAEFEDFAETVVLIDGPNKVN